MADATGVSLLVQAVQKRGERTSVPLTERRPHLDAFHDLPDLHRGRRGWVLLEERFDCVGVLRVGKITGDEVDEVPDTAVITIPRKERLPVLLGELPCRGRHLEANSGEGMHRVVAAHERLVEAVCETLTDKVGVLRASDGLQETDIHLWGEVASCCCCLLLEATERVKRLPVSVLCHDATERGKDIHRHRRDERRNVIRVFCKALLRS